MRLAMVVELYQVFRNYSIARRTPFVFQQDIYKDPKLTKDDTLVAIDAHEDTHDTDQTGIDKIKERQNGGSNDFDVEAASEKTEDQVHKEIQENRDKQKPEEK
jgi:hypothetical protein